MFKKIILVAAMALLAISAQVGSASAGLVNGGFEDGTFNGWTLDTDTNWTIVINSGSQYAGNYEAQLGTYGTPGTLSQAFDTTAGQQYKVSFWVANDMKDATNVFQALWNGTAQALNPVMDPTSSSPYTQYQFTTTATDANATIAFNFQNDPSIFHLDNVDVAAVPVPSSILLLASSLVGLAAVRRKKG